MEYQRDEHRIHLIVFHLIWCPKRRKPVLTGDVAKDCRRLIEGKCQDKGWTILELAIQPDHVHLFVRVWPGDSAAEVIKECKGITSFHLRKKHKQLLRMPSLWTRSYFASTAGNISAETIQRYIEAQKGI
jgi:putative transposase